MALRPFAAVAAEVSISPMSEISIAPNLTREATAEVDFKSPHDYFGPPPLIPGEDPAHYDKLRRRFGVAVKPRDDIEEMFVDEVVRSTWEVIRWRRLRDNLLITSQHKGGRKIAKSTGEFDANILSEKWAAGDPKGIGQVNELLAKAGLAIDAVMGEALASRLDDLERIDGILGRAEARRNNALHEIDRHRASLGAALRRAAEQVEDAEFTDIETDQSSAESPK